MKNLLISLAAVLLTACSTVQHTPAPRGDKDAEALLTSALARVDAASAGTRGADAVVAKAVTAGSSLTMNYAGDAKDLLRMVAASQGKTFDVRGPQPYLPIFVIVNVKDVPFEAFLADVGSQFGQRADLALTNKSIEVRYRGQ